MPAAGPTVLKIKLQIACGEAIAMGPGKADLLEAIAKGGSISAGARALGMSYRRAWLLVDTMNRCWREPLVSAAPGSGPGGGARVTAYGQSVLAGYRALQARAAGLAGESGWDALAQGLRAVPLEHQRAG